MRRIVGNAWIFLVLIFLYFPILLLSFYSFTDASMIGQEFSFSIKNYITLFTHPSLVSMIRGTLILAFVVAVLSTALGTAGAIGAFYSKNKVSSLVSIFNQVPVVNADVVTGFSVCIFFVAILHMDKASFIPLIIGQMVLCAPFVYLSVLPRLKQMDTALFDAALDLGASPGRALWQVIIPQIIPGIISGFMMAITLSLDDYFITTYTKPATFDTISTYVYNATKGSQTTIKTALWALSAIILLIVILITFYSNRRKKSE